MFGNWRPARSTPTGYFSIDDGATSLGSWNNRIAKGDLGDWDSGYGSGGGPGLSGNDAFNNESDYGVINGITQTDLTLMACPGLGSVAFRTTS